MSELPDFLSELDRRLRDVRFEPRASLGPELVGRAGRGERPSGPLDPWRLFAVRAALMVVAAVAVALLVQGPPRRAHYVDVCCHDLDGGADSSDGLVLSIDARGRVDGLLLYEDLDHSRNRSEGDVVRFVRASDLEPGAPVQAEGHRTVLQCCEDLDGEGLPDDAVMVVGRLPDQVHFAAIIQNDGRRRTLR